MSNFKASSMTGARGFTLIELMITVAIIAILAAVALPLYNDYIRTSRAGVLSTNIATIRVFQEDFRLRNNTYVGGDLVAGVPDASLAQLGWDPRTENVDYEVVANGGISYQVTATDETGFSLCLEFPDEEPC